MGVCSVCIDIHIHIIDGWIHLMAEINIEMTLYSIYRYTYMLSRINIYIYTHTYLHCFPVCVHTLRYITLPYPTLPCPPFHSIPFHSIRLHYITLHYITCTFMHACRIYVTLPRWYLEKDGILRCPERDGVCRNFARICRVQSCARV